MTPSPIAPHLLSLRSSWRFPPPFRCAYALCRREQRPHQTKKRQDRGSARNGWASSIMMLIVIMTVIRLFQVAGSATAMVYFNVYMDQQLAISTAMIGAIAAIGRLTGVPTALLTPLLVERWGNVRVVIGASMVATLCLIPMALVEHWLAASFGYIGAISMMSVRYTAFIVYMLDLVPRAQQSVMAGSGEAAAGLSFAMMALGGGLLLTAFTFRDLFLLGALDCFHWHCRLLALRPGN